MPQCPTPPTPQAASPHHSASQSPLLNAASTGLLADAVQQRMNQVEIPCDADDELRAALVESHCQQVLNSLSHDEQLAIALANSRSEALKREVSECLREAELEVDLELAVRNSLQDQQRVWACGSAGQASSSGCKRPRSPSSDSS